MKTLKLIFFITFILSICTYSYAESYETLIVSGHFEYPPFTYQVRERIEGVGIDVVRAIFKELHIKVKSKYVGNWARTMLNLKNGKIDIVASSYITDERKEFAQFTSNYLAKDPMVIFVRKGREFKFEDWDDLTEWRGGDTLGDSRGEKFDNFKKTHLKIELVSSKIINYRKLMYGRIDYAIDGLYPGKIFLRKNGFADRIIPLNTPLQSEYIYIAISKKSKYLKYLPEIDKSLKRMRADGTIDRLIEKHIEIVSKMKSDRIEIRK